MIEALYEKFLKSKGVSTDTRDIQKDTIFFALKGPNFNANSFAGEALEKGASYVVIDDESYKVDDRCVVVSDSLKALQELANFHRKKLKIPVIGITGTNGKTTTKELIHAVLSKKFNTLATEGNLNNHIGVPLTLLSIGKKVEIAIIEMGASKIGDIAELCQIAEPTHGLITNIGKGHTEGFGGIDGVIRGKSELYQYLLETNGKVFINSNNEILSNMAKRFERPYMYPAYADYYHCQLVTADPFLVIKSEAGNLVETNLIGDYNFENIAAALCIGKFFDVPPKKANRGISQYSPKNNRSQISKIGSNTVILDAYNANPNSMQAAINNLASMESENKVAILGDMKELGDISEEEHRQIGALTKEKSFKKVLYCGALMKCAKEIDSHALYFEDRERLKAYLKEHEIKNSLVLIKASRSMGLEDVVGDLEAGS
ncbi:UDP-N-acetylmuramoyl-tripeptide--D-alanyl-D-alanine ligase [Fulvivirgaceae bacterium BMA10]|uniref:UDP-N-acetylmuramoyl-tripeptide--D-alanyl-D-alanine ligase n=1 Tax=Splendidivirga corallicola TaxID=3051826 RepID=A0ABT8KRG0_9BACT|nr:UDP-N-acetylmuramoyl-tripeptide--D-alanyl-D-alanine ligase [Fulvivirgaceae bacterium BMA10]